MLFLPTHAGIPASREPARTARSLAKLPPRVRTYTFGCRVNQADTEAMERRLAGGAGCEIVGGEETPDVVVVNTCTVTAEADRQARQLLRGVHRRYPEARIVVTGCCAQSQPEKIAAVEGVSDVVPIAEQGALGMRLGLGAAGPGPAAGERRRPRRTRALLKMQDGCNAYCSFCPLPYVRGAGRSVPLAQLEREARALAGRGHREIVLTGTHIGAYGRDLRPRVRFSEAVEAIVEAAGGAAIRVSSLEPTGLTPDFIALARRCPRIRPHFHIPLQSGADSVLRRMNRKHTLRAYEERVEALAATGENVAIGADVIAGYPGETQEEFAQTVGAVERLPIAYLHVFPFSPRPGTKAAAGPDDVSSRAKKERVRLLRGIGARKRRAFARRFLGTVQPVIVEGTRDPRGRLGGLTPHYVKVRFPGEDDLVGREVGVRLHSIDGDGAFGEVA